MYIQLQYIPIIDSGMKQTDIEKYLEENIKESDENIKRLIIHEKMCDITDAIEKGFIDGENMREKDITSLSIDRIAKDSFLFLIKEREERDNRIKNASYTKAYKCYKCGHNETTVVYLQTRSGDEPMTAFIKCVKCKNQFKN